MGPLDLCKRLHSCQKYASVTSIFCMYYVVVICMGFILIFLLGPGPRPRPEVIFFQPVCRPI